MVFNCFLCPSISILLHYSSFFETRAVQVQVCSVHRWPPVFPSLCAMFQQPGGHPGVFVKQTWETRQLPGLDDAGKDIGIYLELDRQRCRPPRADRCWQTPSLLSARLQKSRVSPACRLPPRAFHRVSSTSHLVLFLRLEICPAD